MRDALARLDVWRRQLRKSFQYTRVLRDCRAKGLWPPPIEPPADFSGLRVLVTRHDRFGDAMLAVPFLARLRAAGAELRVLSVDRAARALLAGASVGCFASADEAAGWRPQLVIFPATSRDLRSPRYPERWRFVEQVLAALRGTPCVAPSMRRREALSFYAGPCCTPRSGYTALSALELFADGLGLPSASGPLLARWIPEPSRRARGALVLNLSAGKAGGSDRRDLSIAFWSEVARGLSRLTPVSSIVQPGDDARRAEAAADPVLSKGEIVCFEDVSRAAAWLGEQRLLVGPETGLCHLARNLELPMLVLTPPRKVPYFYPPGPGSRFVFAKILAEIAPADVVAAAREFLEEIP